MKLVIDANVGLSTLLPESNSEKALKLFADFRNRLHQLLTPDLYMLEVGNVLVNSARSGTIPQASLPVLYAELMRTLPIVYQSPALFPRACAISSQMRVSVYDAIYLALSESEGCPLLTDDQKLIKAAPGFSFLTFDDL